MSAAVPLAAPSPGFAEAVTGSGLALALERFRQSAGRGCPTSAGLLLPFRSRIPVHGAERFRFAEKRLSRPPLLLVARSRSPAPTIKTAGLHQMRQRGLRLGRDRNDDERAAPGATLQAAGSRGMKMHGKESPSCPRTYRDRDRDFLGRTQCGQAVLDDGLRARAFRWPPLRLAPIVPRARIRLCRFARCFSRSLNARRLAVKEIGRAIGLNVHLDFCEIAICEDGKVRSAGRVASTPEALAVLAESLLPSDRVALEVICAASFLAAIGDIRRFKTSRQLAAYLGLTGPMRGPTSRAWKNVGRSWCSCAFGSSGRIGTSCVGPSVRVRERLGCGACVRDRPRGLGAGG